MSIQIWQKYHGALQEALNTWGKRRTGWGKRYAKRVSINDAQEFLIDGVSLETVEKRQATYQSMPWWKKATNWFSYRDTRSRAALLPYTRAQQAFTALTKQTAIFYNDIVLYEQMIDNAQKQAEYQRLFIESSILREKLDRLRNALTPYHPPVSLLSYEDYHIMQKSLFSFNHNNQIDIQPDNASGIYQQYNEITDTFENECNEIEKGLELFEKMEKISSRAMYDVRKWHLNFHLVNSLDDLCKQRTLNLSSSFLAKATQSETMVLNRALICLSNLNSKMLPPSQQKIVTKLKTLTQIKNYFLQRFLRISNQKAHRALANAYYFMPNRNQLGPRIDDFSLEGTQANLKQCQRIILDQSTTFRPDSALINMSKNETNNFRFLGKIQLAEMEYKNALSKITTEFNQKIKQRVQIEQLKRDYVGYQNKLFKVTLVSKLPVNINSLPQEQKEILNEVDARCQQQALIKLKQSFNERSQQVEQALKIKEDLFLEKLQPALDLYKAQMADCINQFSTAINQRFDQKFIVTLYGHIKNIILHIKLSSYLPSNYQAKLLPQEKNWLLNATENAQQEALLALTQAREEREDIIEKQREKTRSFYMHPYDFAYANYPVDKGYLNLYQEDNNTLWFATPDTDSSIVRRQILVTNPDDPDSPDGLTQEQFDNLSTYLREGSIEQEAGLKKDTVIAVHSLIAREGYNMFSNNDIFYMLAFFYTHEFTHVYVPLYRRIIEWQYAIALQCQTYLHSLQSWLIQNEGYVNLLSMLSNKKNLSAAENEEHCQQLIHNLARAWYKHDKQNPVISTDVWQGRYRFTQLDIDREVVLNQIQIAPISPTKLRYRLLTYYGEVIHQTINIREDLWSVNCPANILNNVQTKLDQLYVPNSTQEFNVTDIQPLAPYILQFLRARHEIMANFQEEHRRFLLETNTDKRENKEARENTKTFKTSDMLKAGLTEFRSLYLDVDEEGSSLYAQHCYSYLKTLVNKRGQTEEEAFQSAPKLNLYENNNNIIEYLPLLKPIEGNELVLKYQDKISLQAPAQTEKMFDFMQARMLETHIDKIILTGIMSVLLDLSLNKAYAMVCNIGSLCRALKPLFMDSKTSGTTMKNIKSATKSIQETSVIVKQQKQTISKLKAQLAAIHKEKNKQENTDSQANLSNTQPVSPTDDKGWSPAMFNQAVPNEKKKEKSSDKNSQSTQPRSTWRDYF
ncbi:MAG: hypothetical protein K2Q14_01220 [Gammaproteobacteria bacterium]|nr:hypothetical protein [Gammaproteobacteria bacterium]